ncbi:MAG: ligand-binding sensor domain-containing protein, partial [Phenylobacterium sp.]
MVRNKHLWQTDATKNTVVKRLLSESLSEMASKVMFVVMLAPILALTLMTSPGMASSSQYFYLPSYSEQLSNLWVTAITQDEQGYIWVGTEEGLNRLDPEQTFSIKGSVAKQLELDDSYIWDLATVDKDRLLVATTTGLYFYHYPDNQFVRFGSDRLFKHYQGGGVFSLSKRQSGSIWVLALNGLYQLDAKGNTLKDWSGLLAQIPNSVDNDFIAIEAIDDTQVYVATRQQIKRINTL